MTLLMKGTDEAYKGALHAYLAGFLTVVASYNLAAYLARRENHLLTNTVIYGTGIAWEIRQAWIHFKGDV